MQSLTPRQEQILKTIVQLYIDGIEEISSLLLDSLNIFSISSATIRNELLELTKKGYLVKTHYASGRKPTLKAIQYFINNLYSSNIQHNTPLNEQPRQKSNQQILDTIIITHSKPRKNNQTTCFKFIQQYLKSLANKFNVFIFASINTHILNFNIPKLIDLGAHIFTSENVEKYTHFLHFVKILEDYQTAKKRFNDLYNNYAINNIAIVPLFLSNTSLQHILIALTPYKCQELEYIGVIDKLSINFLEASQSIWQISQIASTLFPQH